MNTLQSRIIVTEFAPSVCCWVSKIFSGIFVHLQCGRHTWPTQYFWLELGGGGAPVAKSGQSVPFQPRPPRHHIRSRDSLSSICGSAVWSKWFEKSKWGLDKPSADCLIQKNTHGYLVHNIDTFIAKKSMAFPIILLYNEMILMIMILMTVGSKCHKPRFRIKVWTLSQGMAKSDRSEDVLKSI